MIVSCSQCGVKLKVDETKIKEEGSKLRCPKCQNVFTVYRPSEPQAAAPPPPPPPPPRPQAPVQQAPPRPQAAPQAPPRPSAPAASPGKPAWELDRRKVLVAHGGDTVLEMARDILAQAGFETITATDGVQAMIEIEMHKPAVVVLDVGLQNIYGFEICDRLKNRSESSAVKVILIASIFDKTAYKREPTSLYGADDYIEKHHIQDTLARKVNRMLSPVPAAKGMQREEATFRMPPPEEAGARNQVAQEMRKEEASVPSGAAAADSQQVEAARRFARIILSDIALYNQSAVEEGIRNNSFASVLSEELKEGRDLYNSRVPEEVRAQMDYFADEMEKFIEKKKHIMGMGG